MKFDNIRVFNFEGAFRGMRNPKNSWYLSDSEFGIGTWDDAYESAKNVAGAYAMIDGEFIPEIYDNTLNWLEMNYRIHIDGDYVEYACLGKKDMKLAAALIHGGSEHRKFLRQIMVTVDITAPLYWWKEFDTYKVGTTANSTSTMHKLTSKPITLDCFEIDDLSTNLYWSLSFKTGEEESNISFNEYIGATLDALEGLRIKYLETNDKRYWKELVRWLPESWLQTRTVTMNYENILSMVHQREHHKLTEWSGSGDSFVHESFIKFAKSLPYMEDFLIAAKPGFEM